MASLVTRCLHPHLDAFIKDNNNLVFIEYLGSVRSLHLSTQSQRRGRRRALERALAAAPGGAHLPRSCGGSSDPEGALLAPPDGKPPGLGILVGPCCVRAACTCGCQRLPAAAVAEPCCQLRTDAVFQGGPVAMSFAEKVLQVSSTAALHVKAWVNGLLSHAKRWGGPSFNVCIAGARAAVPLLQEGVQLKRMTNSGARPSRAEIWARVPEHRVRRRITPGALGAEPGAKCVSIAK